MNQHDAKSCWEYELGICNWRNAKGLDGHSKQVCGALGREQKKQIFVAGI